MATVRAMLVRVGKLEVERVPPVLAKFGGADGWAVFEADALRGVAEGRYDSRDMPVVLTALQRWLSADSTVRL